MESADPIVLARIGGAHGIKGWVKLISDADPPEGIFRYRSLLMQLGPEWTPVELESGRQSGRILVGKLRDVDDRDAAEALKGRLLAIRPEQLPDLPAGQYYWAELIGLEVIDGQGRSLGRVHHLLETGANDVLVVHGDRERLIPYLPGRVVQEVDLESGRMLVDWDPDF